MDYAASAHAPHSFRNALQAKPEGQMFDSASSTKSAVKLDAWKHKLRAELQKSVVPPPTLETAKFKPEALQRQLNALQVPTQAYDRPVASGFSPPPPPDLGPVDPGTTSAAAAPLGAFLEGERTWSIAALLLMLAGLVTTVVGACTASWPILGAGTSMTLVGAGWLMHSLHEPEFVTA